MPSGERHESDAPAGGKGDPLPGSRVGVFKIEREIGRGGMGAVYLAVRADGVFRQRVAIKLIKRGMDTDFILRRFRQERQILAALNHPNIAQLLDGGTTDDGLPYFVMDYIEGESLYRYGDANKLGIAERLRVMRQICQAVDHAHRNKIIHRDIKPSNILVTKNGTPKLLDFGIAKVLNPELSSETLDPTMTAMRMMTPEYASPEQARGEPATTASDTYALGVLLYELLTGHRPYRIPSRAPHEVARVICEEEPDRPSASVTRGDNLVATSDGGAVSLEFIYQSRGTSVEALRRELAGDLERIVLKALRKKPVERYQTAADLAADINRFLEKRPVLAESFVEEKTTRTAQAKFSERQLADKQAVAILPFKMLGVAAGRSNTDSQEFLGIGLADALITRLSVIKQIVVRPTSSVLPFGETTDPFEAGAQLAVDFIVDGNIRRAGARIRVTVQLLSVKENSTLWAQTFDENFTDVLELEDLISEKVAASLVPRLTGEEQKQLQKRGTNSAAAYEAYLRGRFHWNQFTPESLPKALSSFQTAIRLDPNYALAYVGLADFYIWANIYGLMPSQPALAEAEQAARRAIEIDEQLGEAYASLGLITQNRKQWAGAEKLQQQALKLSPNYAQAHEWWGAQLVGTGNFAEGVEESKLAERLDPLSLRTKTLTAWTLYQARRFVEALARAGEIIELDKNYPQGHSQLGNNLLALGHPEKAIAAFQKFDQMLPDFALAKYQLCFALVAANRRDEAREVLEEVKTLAAKTYVKPFFLAMAHAALDERDEAFAYFEESFDEDEPWMLWFGTEPQLDGLHDDARFVRLLERMKNPLARQFKRSNR